MEDVKKDIKIKDGLITVSYNLIKALEEGHGKERTREITYKVGYEFGEEVGKELGKAPVDEALKKLFQYLTPYFEFKVMDIHKKEDTIEVIIQIGSCIVMEIINVHNIQYPSIACNWEWGIIEGALKTMTGLNAKEMVSRSSTTDMCVGNITFTGVQK